MNNPKNQIQISDLLAGAVANAAERRHLAGMTELSDAASQDIRGTGIISGNFTISPAYKLKPPIIAGGLIPNLPDLRLDFNSRFI